MDILEDLANAIRNLLSYLGFDVNNLVSRQLRNFVLELRSIC